MKTPQEIAQLEAIGRAKDLQKKNPGIPLYAALAKVYAKDKALHARADVQRQAKLAKRGELKGLSHA